MNLGAEPRKVALLAVLLVVAIGVGYMNFFTDEEPLPLSPPPSVATPAPKTSQSPVAARPSTAPPGGSQRPREFRPSLKRSAEQADLSKVDPTLQMGLLAKLQAVTLSGTGRNIFEFSAAPPPPTPKVDPKKIEPKIIPGPIAPPPSALGRILTSPEASKPIAPPIPLKFYGYISAPRGGQRRGFFLDGEEIVVAAEGDAIKQRYKVLRISMNSVEMEDTRFQQRQTLRLEEVPGS